MTTQTATSTMDDAQLPVPTTPRAATCDRYGTAEVLVVGEVAMPSIGPDQVLVAVRPEDDESKPRGGKRARASE